MEQTPKKNNNAGPLPIRPFGSRENLALEFKAAARDLPKNFFETVCAFLNLDGGLIILGVADDGGVTGIAPDVVERLKSEIASLSNNPGKLDPPCLLFPHAEEIGGKWVIKVQVPVSSQVHRTAGCVFLRSEEGDYRITDLNRIAGLVNRKLSFFTEQRVLPYLEMADLRPDIFEKARELMRRRSPQHPWAGLAPDELLRIAGFVRKDVFTGKNGYTLAAALMFGTDEIIQSVAPGYKFDALLRRRDTDRYDDRLIVRTNLVDAFDLLMGFVEKHLDDPFYLEGTSSISLRARIFRELVANIIAHREYTSVAPATMIIYSDRVEFKNPNIPHGRGPIDPAHFTPYPKNPTLCKFLIQLGRYEELGSGVNNVTKYLPFYAPGAGSPSFIEDDMFTALVPLAPVPGKIIPPRARVGLVSGARVGLESTHDRIIAVLQVRALSRAEIAGALGHARVSGVVNRMIRVLRQEGSIEYTIPDKPNSRLQKYRLTAAGKRQAEELK